MKTDTQDIVVGLDIGTTKICCLVGKKNEYGKIEILGIGKAPSLGVMRGVVANIDKTVQSIKQAVSMAEELAQIKVDSVYVGIAGQHIKSIQHRGILTRDNWEQEIDYTDIDRLKSDMHKLAMPPGEKIIHVIPQEYIVDSEQGIIDPIGMCGSRLEVNFHVITGQVAAAQNIERCVKKAGLNMQGLILEPIASSEAVLSQDEKEAGVVLVDIGGGTTDVAIFQGSIIRHSAVIPFGGNIITEDIKEGCMIMKNQAEQLKIRFGSAMAMETQENEIVSIPGLPGRAHKEISIRNLANIIQARMEEIFDQIYFEIKSSGLTDKLIGGIVVTGGGSQLKHLKQLVEYRTGLETRIGFPIEHLASNFDEKLKHPLFSTGVGLMLKGLEVHKGDEIQGGEEGTSSSFQGQNETPKGKWWSKMVGNVQDWFTEGIDGGY